MTDLDLLIAQLEKAAPRSCSKPKSEMCSNCMDRTTSERALKIKAYLFKLNTLRNNNEEPSLSLIDEVRKLIKFAS